MVVAYAALVALILALVLTPVWIRLAPRVGAVDRPRGRHKHRRPTPTSGGLAIFVATWVAVLAVEGWPVPDVVIGLFVASGLLVLLNIYDDIHGLPPLGRLTAQIMLATVAYAWGVRIEGIGNLGGVLGSESWIELGALSGPITVFWIVLITNGLNWLDGLDGLAAGVAGISALTLTIMSTFSPMFAVVPVIGITSAALVGASLGFLRYNFAPARVFMGDTGAMFLGFMLACLSVIGAYKSPTAVAVFLPILVLGVPLFDSTSAILKRILSGKNPLVGDRTHIHHRLIDRGLTVRQAVLVIYAFAGVLCLAALWIWWKQ